MYLCCAYIERYPDIVTVFSGSMNNKVSNSFRTSSDEIMMIFKREILIFVIVHWRLVL